MCTTMMPYRPPLFIDSWRDATDGRGTKARKKKVITQSKKGKRLLPGKNSFQWSPYSRSHFVSEAISDFDILNWIKYMKVKNFNKVLSRDEVLKEKAAIMSSIWMIRLVQAHIMGCNEYERCCNRVL